MVEVVSLLAANNKDMAQDKDINDNDGCTRWMWNHHRRRSTNTNTTIG
jgi:hypothetical protein